VARRHDEVPAWHWFGDDANEAIGAPGGSAPGDYPPADTPTTQFPAVDATTTRFPAADDPTTRIPVPGYPPSAQPGEPAGPPAGAVMGQPPPTDESTTVVVVPGGRVSDPRSPMPPSPRDTEHPSRFLPFGQPPPPPVPSHQDLTATAMIPRVAYYETALIPKMMEKTEAPPSLGELAVRYGLRPAGTRPKLRAYARQLWQFREFITFYANGRLVASVGQARLGRLWLVLTPLLNAAVYFVIFGLVLDLARDVTNFVAYLMAGFVVFNYTSAVAQEAVTSISGQLGLVRAMQFPRASLPIATILMRIQNFVISLVVLLGVVVATGEQVRFEWLWLVPALVVQTVFNTGFALGLARVGATIADARQILPFVMRVWMYMSALFYSVTYFDALPPTATTILHWNPLLSYIELVRYSVMANPPLTASLTDLWIRAVGWALVVLFAGYVFFTRAEAEYGRG